MTTSLRAVVAVLCLLAAGCLGNADHETEASPTGEPQRPHATPPAMLLAGCENHNVYSQAPAATVRPLVPEEFTPFTMGAVAQVQVAYYFCDALALADGTSVGVANWVYVQVRLAEVDPALQAQGITWYLVVGYTDSADIERLHREAGLTFENATFSITPLATRWSFEVEVATVDGPVLHATQVAEPTGTRDSDDLHNHRSLRGSAGTYAWAEQNYTFDRAYAATHTLVPLAGPVAALYGNAPNGLYAIPGTVREGDISFGRSG